MTGHRQGSRNFFEEGEWGGRIFFAGVKGSMATKLFHLLLNVTLSYTMQLSLSELFG